MASATGRKKRRRLNVKHCLMLLSALMVCVGSAGMLITSLQGRKAAADLERQMSELNHVREEAKDKIKVIKATDMLPDSGNNTEITGTAEYAGSEESAEQAVLYAENGMLMEYAALYAENPDFIGWLTIDGTVIDYPVMQTPADEEYYLYRDFFGKPNKNGCLIMDTDSKVGVGTRKNKYTFSEPLFAEVPSTNLIIHGHTMKSGDMFGDLPKYRYSEYGKTHSIIRFDSLYESREYELISVFYSQVYRAEDKCFKYYNFFQASTQEEFDDWYDNITAMRLYDTGVAAEFGDEFITLSCCAYQNDNGRFVVVGKRMK